MAKILLVEDDTNLSEIYQARMEAEGYEVVSASDGESALAVAAKEKPDLIISDVMMPKISGFEMLDILRNTDGLKNTPVIMLTALGQTDDKGRAEQLGADRYLVKSQVTLEDIVNAAHALLEGDSTPPAATAQAAATTDTAETPTSTPAEPAAPAPAPTGPLASTDPATPPPAAAPTDAPAAAPQPDTTAPAANNDVPVIPVATPPADTETPAAEPAPSNEQPASNEPDKPDSPPDNPDVAAAPAEPQAEQKGEENSANFPQGGSPAPAAASQAAPAGPTAAPEVLAVAQTAAQESEKIKSQIAGFEHRPVAPVQVPRTPAPAHRVVPTVGPPPAAPAAAAAPPTPAAPATPPAPTQAAQPATQTPPEPLGAHAIDEKVVARAIEQLVNKVPQAASPPSSQQAEHGRVLPSSSEVAPAQAADRPQKKVIAPLDHPPQPSLAELVAREEAKEMAIASAANNLATMASAPQPAAPAVSEAIPQAVMPSEDAAQPQPATPTTQPTAPVPSAVPVAPAPASQPAPNKPAFDPNSIAL